MKFILYFILPIIIMFGLINYIWAIVRSKKKSSGKWNNWLYVILQILITVLYLAPCVAILGYCYYVYFKPTLFVDADWFYWSIAGYFAIILAVIIVGIILIRKQCDGYYKKDEVFMYAVKHRAIISFVGCAIAITGMIFGLINFGMYHFKVISMASEIEEYTNQKYLALDISDVDESINGYKITTSKECETLIVKGDPERIYKDIYIETYATNVSFEDFRIQSSMVTSTIKFNADTRLQLTGNCMVNGDIFFYKSADIDLLNSSLLGNLLFENESNILIDDNSTISGNIEFKNASQLMVDGEVSGELILGGNSSIDLLEKGLISGKITINESCNSVYFKGDKEKLVNVGQTSDNVQVKETKNIKINVEYLDRSNDFSFCIENISLTLDKPLEYIFEAKFSLTSIGEENIIKSLSGSTTFNTNDINISVDGKLAMFAPETGATNALFAKDILLSGEGECFFTAGNAKNLGECGGTAVTAKTLTCVGALNVTLVGGNGATGVTGVTGTTGYTGQKGNNESQGKDSVYGYNGRPGGPGGTGGIGGLGGAGGTALKLDSLPSVTELCELKLVGGVGGTGGRGGTGGCGGTGGAGGDDDYWSFIWIGDMSGGEGGAGGPGGEGGEGGSGGTGGFALIVQEKNVCDPLENVVLINGEKGTNGSKGYSGSTGSKGAHGDGGAGG